MNPAALEKLDDIELSDVIEQAQRLLVTRKQQREAEAMDKAREALEKVGLSLKDLVRANKRGSLTKHSHASRKVYRHPENSRLEWAGRGNKPQWLRDLEQGGGKPIEVPAP